MSKSVNMFLIDDDPTGKIKCTLSNWTGAAYKIPRGQLDDYKNWSGDILMHIKQSGIYFLLGKNEDTDKPIIYVGQAIKRKIGEGIIRRLLEHSKNENESYYNLWNEVIVLTTSNNILGATELNYLENRFTNMAFNASRYEVLNGNEPNPGNLTEEKESEMDEFIKLSKIIVGVLGHKVFESPVAKEEPKVIKQEITSPIFTFKGKYKAKGIITNEGFVVLKDSQISKEIQKSCPEGVVKLREQYKDKIKNYVTTVDIIFNSTSSAAKFIGGSSLSGNACWRTDDDKCPKDYGM